MCGLAGIILGKKRRTKKEIQQLLDIFTRLLILSEARGHHATGVAWVTTDGTFVLFKGPIPASQFVREPRYADLLAGVDNRTTVLMGHTRWRTQGSELNNLNNHPLLLGGCEKPGTTGTLASGTRATSSILLAHNGHVGNADALFRRFRFARQAQAGSEILAHFAARASNDGAWDISRLHCDFALCRGTLTVVAVSTALPDQTILFAPRNPLVTLYNAHHRAFLYASSALFLTAAIDNLSDWRLCSITLNRILLLKHDAIAEARLLRPLAQ